MASPLVRGSASWSCFYAQRCLGGTTARLYALWLWCALIFQWNCGSRTWIYYAFHKRNITLPINDSWRLPCSPLYAVQVQAELWYRFLHCSRILVRRGINTNKKGWTQSPSPNVFQNSGCDSLVKIAILIILLVCKLIGCLDRLIFAFVRIVLFLLVVSRGIDFYLYAY